MSQTSSRSDQWLARMRTELAPELEVGRLLGKGAMARVLLAREPALKRLVAVKVLRHDLASDEVARARFEREAQAVAAIRHPNVTEVYRVGRVGPVPYIVMEYIEGRTLADLLASGGPFEPGETARILASVAHALAAAHARGIVHRDVRPSNVMVEGETDRVVLMDFGIAALLETGSRAAARLTETGVRLGDPLRRSPEQEKGGRVTAQTDVYCLGILGHELLTGRPLTPADRDAETGVEDGFFPELERIIRRCLRETPDHRPTAREAAYALASASESRQTPTGRDPTEGLPILRDFIRDLRQRKVGRVAIAYMAAAFVFLQGVDLLMRALPTGDPEVWYQGIVALTLAGFPVALVLSWVLDITSEGIRRAPEQEKPGSPGARTWRFVLPVVGLALSILAAIGVWLLIYRP